MKTIRPVQDAATAARANTLAEIAAHFYRFKWLLGTSGSLSCRQGSDPLEILITVSGQHKGELGVEDFLSVTDDGEVFETLADPKASSESLFAGLPKPSGETLVHKAIYDKYPDAGAVFHVHSVPGTLCSQMGDALEQAPLEMHKGLGRWTGAPISIPIVDNALHIPTLAALVADAAKEEIPGVLVNGHGIYVWGPDIPRCRRHVEIFEFLFEYEVQKQMMR